MYRQHHINNNKFKCTILINKIIRAKLLKFKLSRTNSKKKKKYSKSKCNKFSKSKKIIKNKSMKSVFLCLKDCLKPSRTIKQNKNKSISLWKGIFLINNDK